MKYGSVCSGIEAASVAWESLGWKAQWFSEIESFPSAVLAHRFPDVPNLGDMTKLNENEIFRSESIDLLVGGTPCQSFSVAGLRKGLADPRGNLMLTFLSLADSKKPRWIVWENVPGVLSSNGGRDFGTFLGALGELGYGFAYRVLDAQYFGVAQRRRRVFVVGYLGDWRPAAAVLFESESLQRYIKPRRAKGEEVASNVERGFGNSGVPRLSNALCARDYKGPRPEADQGAPVIVEINKLKSETTWWDGGQTAATLTKQNANGAQRMPDKDNFGAVIEQVAQPIAVDVYNQTIDGQTSATLTKAVGGTNTSGPKIAQPVAVDWRTTQVDVEMTGTLKTDLAKMSGPCIAVDCFNQTINEKTSQTIGSSASDVNHYGAVLQPTIIDRAAFNQGQNAQYEPRIEEGQTMSSLVAKGPHAVQHTINRAAFNQEQDAQCEPLTFYNVVKEVRVRKYEVDVESLKTLLKNHKNKSNIEIANALNLPKTLVDHWFRHDNSFAVPDPESWVKLKVLLNITDNTFDKSITEFEYKDNEYDSSNRIYDSSFVSPTLTSSNSGNDNYLHTMAIRRLTPKECERLQGFPDNWTKIPYKKKSEEECPDGPRYKACGNSMAVPVMRWIGQRIQRIENMLAEEK